MSREEYIKKSVEDTFSKISDMKVFRFLAKTDIDNVKGIIEAVVDEAYSEGRCDGYTEGYDDGYSQGMSDAY